MQREMKAEMSFIKTTIVRQSRDIEDLRQEVVDLKTKSMRNNVLMHGMAETKLEDSEKVFRDFLNTSLGIKNPGFLEAVYRIGKKNPGAKTPRIILGRFLSQREAEATIETAGRWKKGQGRKLNGHIHITMQQPPEVTRERRELGIKAKTIRDKIPNTKTAVKGTTLLVNNVPQKELLPIPSTHELMLEITAKEAGSLKITECQPIVENGFTATAMVTTTTNLNEIRETYKKLKRQPQSQLLKIVVVGRTYNPDGGMPR